MRLNLVGSTGIVVGIIAILLIAPTVCAASESMDMTVATHDSGSYPQYSSTTVSPLSYHVLMNALSEQATPPRLVPAGVILSWSPVNLNIEPSPTQTRPLQRDIVYIIIYIVLTSIPLEYHCRNYPNSEEPPL